MRIRRMLAVVAVLAASCGGGSDDERRILVDFSHDEFATFVLNNFPRKVTVTQGQTLVFKQTWTGEPHTITGGTAINESIAKGVDWLDFFQAFEALAGGGANFPDPGNPGDATLAEFVAELRTAEPRAMRDQFTRAWNALRGSGVPLPDLAAPGDVKFGDVTTLVEEQSERAFGALQFASDDEGDIAQNLGRPCYLRTGTPPQNPDQPCTAEQQRQPRFDGKHSFYNSGILPYEGERGNTYKIELTDDVSPGTYFFYCAIHGPGQLSQIEVKRDGADVPSQGEVSRRARQALDRIVNPLERVYRRAERQNTAEVGGEVIRGPFAGLGGQGEAGINEFVPRTIRAKVNEPIVWKMMGTDHTISFDVPAYFPIVDFESPEGIRFNPRLRAPAGGAPEFAEPQDGAGIAKVDGGTYDGDGFWSSGLIGANPYLEYTLRISKPGTYDYACLIHPPMVGKIVVTD